MSSKARSQSKDRVLVRQPEARSSETFPQRIYLAPIIQQGTMNPHSLSLANVLHLQRAIGNRAVGKLLIGTIQRAKTKVAKQANRIRKAKPKVRNKVKKNGKPARPAGISLKLARQRWLLKHRKGVEFKDWKRGYEAQHIIPYAVAINLDLPIAGINDAWNGMMLPSGRKGANQIIYRAKGKALTRPKHIKKGMAHPIYNNKVQNFLIEEIKKLKGIKIQDKDMIEWADYIRKQTKLLTPYQSVDDIQL